MSEEIGVEIGVDIMTPSTLTEDSLAEQPAIEWFQELGYECVFGSDIGLGGGSPEIDDFSEVLLKGRLQDALKRLSPDLPEEALDDAFHQFLYLDSPNLFERNHAFHRMAVKGVRVVYQDKNGEEIGDRVQSILMEIKKFMECCRR